MTQLLSQLTPVEVGVVGEVGVGGRDALRALAESERDPLPVMQGDTIVGLLHRGDIARWLALHHLES